MRIFIPPNKCHKFGLSLAFLGAALLYSNMFWSTQPRTIITYNKPVDEALLIEKKIQELEEHIMKQDQRLEQHENKSSSLEDKILQLQASKSISTLDSEEASFVTSVKKCVQPATGIWKGKSQSGEDAFLMKWFGGLCGGTRDGTGRGARGAPLP